MERKIPSLKIIGFIAALLLANVVYAQKWTIEVTGSIFSKDKNLTGAKATIYAYSNLVMSVTSVNGTFDFFLEPDNDYTLTFSKAGFAPTYILFSTKNVPEKRAKQGFSAYNIVVLLEPRIKGSAAEQSVNAPQAVVKYDSAFEGGDFTYDKGYAKTIKPFLKVVNKQVKEAVEQQNADDRIRARQDISHLLYSFSGTMLIIIIAFASFARRSRKEKKRLLEELEKERQNKTPA